MVTASAMVSELVTASAMASELVTVTASVMVLASDSVSAFREYSRSLRLRNKNRRS